MVRSAVHCSSSIVHFQIPFVIVHCCLTLIRASRPPTWSLFRLFRTIDQMTHNLQCTILLPFLGLLPHKPTKKFFSVFLFICLFNHCTIPYLIHTSHGLSNKEHVRLGCIFRVFHLEPSYFYHISSQLDYATSLIKYNIYLYCHVQVPNHNSILWSHLEAPEPESHRTGCRNKRPGSLFLFPRLFCSGMCFSTSSLLWHLHRCRQRTWPHLGMLPHRVPCTQRRSRQSFYRCHHPTWQNCYSSTERSPQSHTLRLAIG